MPLIASISGIRGVFGDGLDAGVLVRYSGAFGAWCREKTTKPRVVVGRDGRVTGPVCTQLVVGTLRSVGCDVIDAGMASTPTVAMAVMAAGADGGIVLSASHNPAEWNALKLLDSTGEYVSPEDGARIMALADAGHLPGVTYTELGRLHCADYLEHHVASIQGLDFCRQQAIAKRGFKVVIDGINSVGAIAMPRLLNALGVREVKVVNGDPSGLFAHPAEPLPGHLHETMEVVRSSGADLGLVVDPDADRLALIEGSGRYVSEELTQVLAADFLWRHKRGPFVTNLSSSRAIDDVAARYGMPVFRSAVGEINVVKKMQEVGAILGGEGNGGVILPDLHYGRDGLLGAAMVLQHLADEGISLAAWCATMPRYVISKNKIPLGRMDAKEAMQRVADGISDGSASTEDGLKIDFEEGWVGLRKSNTEPVLRVYAEARTEEGARTLARRVLDELA